MDIPYKIIDATAFEKDKIYLLNVELANDIDKSKLTYFGEHLRNVFNKEGIHVIINFSNQVHISAQEIKEPEVKE